MCKTAEKTYSVCACRQLSCLSAGETDPRAVVRVRGCAVSWLFHTRQLFPDVVLSAHRSSWDLAVLPCKDQSHLQPMASPELSELDRLSGRIDGHCHPTLACFGTTLVAPASRNRERAPSLLLLPPCDAPDMDASTVNELLAGSVGGAAQVIVGQPLDTIKTRAQTAPSSVTFARLRRLAR